MTQLAIDNLFRVIATTANSAGDTLTYRESVDLIMGAIEQLKPLIVEAEMTEYNDQTKRKGPRK